jgi:uncharacterized protein
MRYNVAQLLKGPSGARRRYGVREAIGDLDQDLEPVRPLEGSVTLTRTSQGVLVTGRLGTALQQYCGRCLEPCTVEVQLDIEEEFYPSVLLEAPLDAVPEEESDEALLIDEHHTLDLSEVIRQGLWVASPMEALCRPECAGLCPRCGGNRNMGECECDQVPIDPRWAALQSLLPNEPDDSTELIEVL